ncbi:hypothetical protein EG835_01290, partial [bacterium]|nr:hypothetical protein [bacterium]
MYLEHASLDERDKPFGGIDRCVGYRPVVVLDDHLAHARGEARLGVLLVEALAVGALGAANQHERPVLEVRQDPRRDLLVVLRELPLHHADAAEQHLVGMREPHARDRVVLVFPGLGRFEQVLPQSLVRRVPNVPSLGPLGERHLHV